MGGSEARACFAALARVALALASQPARADVERVQVKLEGPPGCGDGDQLWREVRARTSRVRLASAHGPATMTLVVRNVNGDGFADVVVSAADVNGDGIGDLVVGAAGAEDDTESSASTSAARPASPLRPRRR